MLADLGLHEKVAKQQIVIPPQSDQPRGKEGRAGQMVENGFGRGPAIDVVAQRDDRRAFDRPRHQVDRDRVAHLFQQVRAAVHVANGVDALALGKDGVHLVGVAESKTGGARRRLTMGSIRSFEAGSAYIGGLRVGRAAARRAVAHRRAFPVACLRRVGWASEAEAANRTDVRKARLLPRGARMLPTKLWMDMTWRDFERADMAKAIAVLPVAAVEQHGPHLPVGADAFINEGHLARAIALTPPDLDVLYLPVQSIGASAEHLAFPAR